MQITNITPLYRYVGEDNSVIITPNKRNDNDEIQSYSIVADEGYELYYNGENQFVSVLYVEDTDGWTQELNLEPERKRRERF